MNNYIIKGFQYILNGSLVLLGVMLTILMVRELWTVLMAIIADTIDIHFILQEVLSFFLYFAFVSMIVKYFREDYHFPIRYLLYIGITGTLRFLIVNNENPMENLILAFVILILMFAYSLNASHSQKAD